MKIIDIIDNLAGDYSIPVGFGMGVITTVIVLGSAAIYSIEKYKGKYEGALAKVEELAKEMAEKEIKIVPKEQLKKLAEDLEKMDVLARKAMDDQDEVIKAQGLKIQELEEELKNYREKEKELKGE